MRTELDLDKLQTDLWKYAEQTSRFASPVDEGTFIGYAAEIDFPIEDNLQMLDFCDPDNIQAQLFLHISEHWLHVRRDFPSGILAFMSILPSFLDAREDVSYETIQMMDYLIYEFKKDVKQDYKKLRRQNEMLLIKFLKFRVSLEALDPLQRNLQARNYQCVVFLILPCLYRLGQFLTDSLDRFTESKKKWRRFRKDTRKSSLDLVPLPSNLWPVAEDLITKGIIAFISSYFLAISGII